MNLFRKDGRRKVFKDVLGRSLNLNKATDHSILQSMMYILQELGVKAGYTFVYVDLGHPVYSFNLYNDVTTRIDEDRYRAFDVDYDVSNFGRKIKSLRRVNNIRKNCSEEEWWKIIASTIYWKKEGMSQTDIAEQELTLYAEPKKTQKEIWRAIEWVEENF